MKVYELDFVFTLQPASAVSNSAVAEFIFPMAITEDPHHAALLMPFPVAENVFENWDAMKSMLENGGCAFVNIPYQVAGGQFGFGVYIAWLGQDTPAIGEMLVLDKYKERLYERYRHLCHEVEYPELDDPAN